MCYILVGTDFAKSLVKAEIRDSPISNSGNSCTEIRETLILVLGSHLSYDARDVKSFNRHSFDIAILARANMKLLVGGSFSKRPDSRSGVGGVEIATPDMPPLDDIMRIGVDICF